VKKSMLTIIRAFMMYKPLRFFTLLGIIPIIISVLLGVRFLIYLYMGTGNGHVQSLILASTMFLTGIQTIIIGLQADVIAANRKILEDIQYHVRKMDYDSSYRE